MHIPDRKKIINKLLKNNIPLVLIGAQAIRVYGSSRESFDIDFAARSIDTDKIIDIMYSSGYRLPISISSDDESVTWAKSTSMAKQFFNSGNLGALNFYYLDEDNDPIDQIDFIFNNPIPFMKLIKRAIPIRENSKILCASIEDLILMKEKRIKSGNARTTDHVDLEFLKEKKQEIIKK